MNKLQRSRWSISRGRAHSLAGRALLALVTAIVPWTLADPVSAQTRSAILEWDANTDALTAGYQVLVGTAPGSHITTLDVGLSTRAPLALPIGGRYYVAVRAYAANGATGPASVEAIIDLTGPPGQPSGLSAAVSGSRVNVSWAPPVAGAVALTYGLSVGTFPGGSDVANGVSVGAANSIAGDLSPGVYYARAFASNLMGVGPASNEVTIRVNSGPVPGNPSGLAVSWSGTTARLSWNPPSGQAPTSYLIEAGTAPGLSNAGQVNVGAATAFTAELPTGAYYVRVRSLNANGVSGPSNEILVQRAATPPPGQVPGFNASVQGGTVVLSWGAPTTGGPVEGYVLEAGTASGLSNLGSLEMGTSRTFSAAIPPGTYYVRVRARNGSGVGAASREVKLQY